MREVDGLSVIVIDFYVPALAPRLSSTQTFLQLSENIILFAVCRIYTGVWAVSFMCTVQCGGNDGTLWHPCLYIPWCRHFTFDRDSEFSLRKKSANKLD
jgi:hypothetical protein